MGSSSVEEVLIRGQLDKHGSPLGVSQNALPHESGDEFVKKPSSFAYMTAGHPKENSPVWDAAGFWRSLRMVTVLFRTLLPLRMLTYGGLSFYLGGPHGYQYGIQKDSAVKREA